MQYHVNVIDHGYINEINRMFVYLQPPMDQLIGASDALHKVGDFFTGKK